MDNKELKHFLLKDKGISLVEIMIVMVILAVILTTIYNLYFFGIRNLNINAEANVLRQQTSLILRNLSQELRETLGPQSLEDIKLANKNEISFYADFNNDGKIELIHYYLNNKNLMKGIVIPKESDPLDYSSPETTVVVAENVLNNNTNPLFRYFDKSGAELTNLPLDSANRNKVVTISLKIIADKDTSKPPNTIILEVKVYLRNKKSD